MGMMGLILVSSCNSKSEMEDKIAEVEMKYQDSLSNDDEYESLRKALESHYSGDRSVNRVYRNMAGTIMIDSRN